MGRRVSLAEAVQCLLERTYRMHSGVHELGRFIVGDRGYRRLYAGNETVGAGSVHGDGSKTLVRETDDGIRLCIYFPDRLIRHLEQHPPVRGIHAGNVDAFATLDEEVDHLLLLAERALQGRSVTLFELELHANVSKHLVLTRFLAGSGGRIDSESRLWLRYQLFEKFRYTVGDFRTRARYREASRWGVKLIDGLGRIGRADERIATLRRFHVSETAGKIGLIRSLAA